MLLVNIACIPFQIPCQNSCASLVYLLSFFSLRIPNKLASLAIQSCGWYINEIENNYLYYKKIKRNKQTNIKYFT